MTATAAFQAAKEKVKAAREEAQRVARDAFKEGATALFASNDSLESFGWKQYTPYFNDGDECVFGAHIDEPEMNGKDYYDFDEVRETKWENGGKAPNPTYVKALGDAYQGVRDFLRSFDEEDFKELFGDHVEVKVGRDGSLTTEEYSHD